jgi:threonine dehydratase
MSDCAAMSDADLKQRKPCFRGVLRAHEKISEILPATPVMQFWIGGVTVWAKAESLQPIGAFKLRGAWHRLTDLSPEARGRGVVAFSSGNHAQGVAWAAVRLGIDATIIIPSDAPPLKIEATRTLGANVILYDRMSEDRAEIAARLAAERGATLVPSFDDPWIIEGQGSAGLEAKEQLGFEPDLVVTPCGGGGLAAGLALALPKARIVVAEPEGWDDMAQSLMKGQITPVGVNPPPTSCDALMTLQVSPLTFGVLHERKARGVAVSDGEVAAAMRYASRTLGLRLEPGGAAGLAALLCGKIGPAGRTLVILSGGNVDPTLFSAMVAD